MWYNQRLWSEEEMKEFLAANGLSTDEFDNVICRVIASGLRLVDDKEIALHAAIRAIEVKDQAIKHLENEINELKGDLEEYEAKRYYTQCRINEKDKRIKELEDFLNETQARIRGALRTEKP